MMINKYILPVFFFILISSDAISQVTETNKPYKDLSHFSTVFGHEKNYRIYLPTEYNTTVNRYPVIYFFHGWGGRHYKDDNALLEYELIGELVNKYKVILVMWDGNIEESEPRPYNIGNHKDVKYSIQMKDYFPELVNHIDSAYRTLNQRSCRGIIGFSMGGIMSFFLAGKYPDMVCSAVDLAGSPEFFIGYPGNHTLYPLRYTFKNLMEVSARQHGGDSDILVHLNREVKKGAEWEGYPYEFYEFRGGHMIDPPGETAAFEMAMSFISDKFGKEAGVPALWCHYDIYPEFSVWDFHVASNKQVPGFLFLRNVSNQGFGFYTYKWLPDGPFIPGIQAKISTSPVYTPGKTYATVKWTPLQNDVDKGQVVADREGRISLIADGYGMEAGIYDDRSKPDFIAASYILNESDKLLKTGEESNLVLELFNRGGEIKERKKLQVSVMTHDSTVIIKNSTSEIWVESGERLIDAGPFTISTNKQPPAHGEPFQIKLKVKTETDDTSSSDEIIMPVLFYNVDKFENIRIDDGRKIKDKAFGAGNNDGIVNAGERIMLYESDRRLRLYSNDKWVDRTKEVLHDEQLPAVWEDGFTLSSIIQIKEDCPDGHIIEFIGSYETNTWNPVERNLHWGKVYIRVVNRYKGRGANEE